MKGIAGVICLGACGSALAQSGFETAYEFSEDGTNQFVFTSTTGQPPTQSRYVVVQGQVEVLEGKLRAMEAELAAARIAAQNMRLQVAAGVVPASELPPLDAKVLRLQAELTPIRMNLMSARRYAALSQLVTVSLRGARIRTAADTLSRLSSMNIEVDPRVPKDIVITTKGSNVPLGTVIELIANTAELSITGSNDGGLLLTVPSKMQLNGKAMVVRTGNWPWNDDLMQGWSVAYLPLGKRWENTKMFRVETPDPFQTTWSDNSRHVSLATNGFPSVTAVGKDQLVVAEQGIDSKGRRGLWLTVYKIKDGRLKATSRVFHRNASSNVQTRRTRRTTTLRRRLEK